MDKLLQFVQQIGTITLLILRDQAWAGIGGLTAIAGLFLTLHSTFTDKSRQQEVEKLKRLLRREVLPSSNGTTDENQSASTVDYATNALANFMLPFLKAQFITKNPMEMVRLVIILPSLTPESARHANRPPTI